MDKSKLNIFLTTLEDFFEKKGVNINDLKISYCRFDEPCALQIWLQMQLDEFGIVKANFSGKGDKLSIKNIKTCPVGYAKIPTGFNVILKDDTLILEPNNIKEVRISY